VATLVIGIVLIPPIAVFFAQWRLHTLQGTFGPLDWLFAVLVTLGAGWSAYVALNRVQAVRLAAGVAEPT
jgi:hypothetical protein